MVDVGVTLGVNVAVGGSSVGVGLGVGVSVRVGVRVRLGVRVRVGVRVTVSVGSTWIGISVGTRGASPAGRETISTREQMHTNAVSPRNTVVSRLYSWVV
jgi:hypothetical protein